MTEDDKALVERLRDGVLYGDARLHNPKGHDPLRMEAADRIEALSAENERLANAIADRLLGSSIDGRTIKELVSENKRLREALREVTTPPHFGESEQNKAWWAKARAALGETK